MGEPISSTNLAIVGAGIGGCALAAALRLGGWAGSIALLEIGRGAGGRSATRRSRRDPDLRINHGAPFFNITGSPAPQLLQPLRDQGWITAFQSPICSLDGQGQLHDPLRDGFSVGELWQGNGGMDQICRGLLELASDGGRADPRLLCGSVVKQLEPRSSADGAMRGWRLRNSEGQELIQADWLVVSGTLLAHPRCRTVFGWNAVPLQEVAAQLGDPALEQAAAALGAIESLASSHLLLTLAPAAAQAWLEQPWRILQCQPQAQERWGLRRISQQSLGDGRCAVVVESSAAFAQEQLQVYGSRSSAAQLLGAATDAEAELAVMDALEQRLHAALGLSTAGADRQLMRWGAAFPQEPGLAPEQQLCSSSRIGFCGDAIAGPGFGRVEGALRSAEALAKRLLPELSSLRR